MKRKIRLWLMSVIIGCGVMSASEKGQEAVLKNDTAAQAEIKSSTVLEELQEIRSIQQEAFDFQKKLQEQREEEIKEFNKSQEGKKQSDIGVMAQIERNTKEDFVNTGWTLFALVTLAVSIITFLAQWSTERHTKNVSIDSQLGVLKDLPRHFYRNLVCTVAMLIKYRHKDNKDKAFFKAYPSEANVMKLQTLSEEFILPIDTADNHIFDEMHEQKLLFKNYNIEVAAAANHFSRKKITEKSLVNDYDNILFKPIFLITKLCKLYIMLNRKKWFPERMNPEIYVSNVICTFAMEHFNKLKFNNIVNGMQQKYYNEICRDEDFEYYIIYDKSTQYDSIEKPIYANGIERSLNNLLDLLKDIKDVNFECFLMRKKVDNQIKYYINRKKFEIYFSRFCLDEWKKNKEKNIVRKENKYPFNKIRKAATVDEMLEEFGLKGKPYEIAVRSYFEFWKKDEWEVKEFLYNLLKIDAILELPIIGMIEHEALNQP